MTLARRLATGDTYTVFVTSRMRTETRASSASVYGSSVPMNIDFELRLCTISNPRPGLTPGTALRAVGSGIIMF